MGEVGVRGLRSLLYSLWKRPATYWAHLLHRVTGLILFAFIILHIWDVGLLLQGADAYDIVVREFVRPEMLPADILLFAVGVFHGANGVRLILAELGLLARRHRQLFWIMMVLGLIAWAWISYVAYLIVVGEL